MGWSGHPNMTVAQVIKRREARWAAQPWGVVLARGGNRWRLIKHHASGNVFILCTLWKRSGGETLWKDIEATMGPNEVDCPLSWLDRATSRGSYFESWAAEVREYHAARAERAARPKLQPYMLLQLGDDVKPDARVLMVVEVRSAQSVIGRSMTVNELYRVNPARDKYAIIDVLPAGITENDARLEQVNRARAIGGMPPLTRAAQ